MYFTVVSAPDDEESALTAAVEQVAESLDAEYVAVVHDGRTLESVGLPDDSDIRDGLIGVAESGSPQLPFLGPCHMLATRASDSAPEVLVAARCDGEFSAEERQMAQGMAQVLALALRAIRTVNNERRLREEKEIEAEERSRLLAEVRERERLLEQLLEIQRAVSRREPLPVVLAAVAAGAAELLDEALVAVVHGTDDPDDALVVAATSSPLSVEVTRAVHEAARSCMDTAARVRRRVDALVVLAVPITIGSLAEGSLIAVQPAHVVEGDERDLLMPFAQQAGAALLDARTLEEVEEARHDHLTGLPSRALFLQRLEETLQRRTADTHVSLLFVDLDGFKQVNDSLGHAAGDDLLVMVAARLRRCVRQADRPARLGGDEFAVLVLDDAEGGLGRRMAERIIAAMAEPFVVVGREVYIGASIGIVAAPAGRSDGEALLSDADVAMYRAKKRGDSTPVVFQPAMRAEVVQRLDLQSDLRRALQAKALELHYQPIVRLADRRPVALEALLRWSHPERGPVPPTDFIAVAEDTGLIFELGRWVLREAVRQIVRWRAIDPALTINVNVSGHELAAADFPEHVLAVLSEAGVPPDAVTLELTETALMGDAAQAPDRLRRLHDVGVRLAVDDFGTGYSSLAYLRRLPVDDLKIDRAFVDGVATTPEDLAVARAVVDLSATLRMHAVAEGIEHAEQRDALLALGCEFGQGYHLARPLPGAEVAAYLSAALHGRRREEPGPRLRPPRASTTLR